MERACTNLIQKNGDTPGPANFSSITLESISLKIFTSCLRDSMYTVLKSNGFIEHRIQRVFFLNYPELLNTLLEWLMSSIKLESNKDLLSSPTTYPQSLLELSMITRTFQTSFITVGRSVLQGNCVSLLTSSLCFNTYIHYIPDQKFKKVGFIHNLLSIASTGLNLQTM